MSKIHFMIILDHSGSMEGVRNVTVKGANDLIHAIAEQSKDSGVNSTISLVTFASDVTIDKKLQYVPSDKFGDVDDYYVIGGGTAIYDAMGLSVNGFSFDHKDDRAVVILFTDGEEYNSNIYDASAVKKMLDGKST